MLLPLLNTINADQLTKMNRADPMDTVNPLVARLIDVEKPSPPAPDSDGGYCFCLNAGQYFDVEEQDIGQRLAAALLLRPPFHEVIADKPDLYGPLWIAVTLVAITVASSSLQAYLSDTAVNFGFIPVAAALVFCMSFVCPYVMAVVVRLLGGHLPIARVMCVYGYSMTAFVPATCVCFVPWWALQTVALVAGFAVSLAFLLRNVLALQGSLDQSQRTLCVALLVGSQSILLLTFKFYFFTIS